MKKTLLTTAVLMMAAILFLAGCKKDNPQPDEPGTGTEVEMVPVSCTVDIQGNARDGLSVMTFGSGFSLSSDSTQLNVMESSKPQLIVVADEEDHVRMLYRNVLHEGQSIEVNAHTTALAMVTCHPLVAMVGDSDFVTMTGIIERLQTFPAFESKVNSRIAAGGDLFDTNNTEMLRSVQAVLEELLGTGPDTSAQRKDSDPMPWADYSPLRAEWVNRSQGKFNLSNYSLVPTYYGTISTPEGRADKLVLPTVGSYSLVGAAWDLMWRNTDNFYGERVLVTLTKGTTNTISLTNLNDARAVVDFGARLIGDLIGVIGLPLPEGFKRELAETAGGIVADAVANVTANSDHAMREAAKSIWDGVCGHIGGKIKEGLATGAVFIAAEVYEQGWAKRIWKIGVDNIFKWYSMAEGTTNLSLRIYYYIKYPNDIEFCANYSDNDSVGACCDCNITSGDWVDLGLPSGLLWATRNVGASSPTDYGNYYAWGETSPKSTYTWENYRYYRCDDNGCGLTKYCNDPLVGYKNYTDGRTTLQSEDDAATANYGGRTPTAAEWQELINNTTSRWVTVNGVNGYCFRSSNGNNLFLPAAGTRGFLLYSDGSIGCYWSSSLDTDDPRNAWTCGSGSGFVVVDDWLDNRFDGLSVRAVRQP